MSTTNILDLNNRIDALEKNSGGGGSADSAKRSDIATEFSATTAYTAGCFVYYEGKLYQFNADHAAGAWDPTDVVEANVTDQVVSNASAIAGLTASDVAYDNTDSGLTAAKVQGAIDELADSYPAAKVMLSDEVTSVEDEFGIIKGELITYVKNPITALAVSTAWGTALYSGNVSLDISSLNLQNIPDIVSAVYQLETGGAAMTMVTSVSKTTVGVDLVRATSATLTGNLIIGIKSNG